MSIREAIAPLIDLVYPPRCPMCGDAIGAQTGLCTSCWSQLEVPLGPRCASCQMPLARVHDGAEAGGSYAQTEGDQCGDCAKSAAVNGGLGHDGIAAATLYNSISRQLVLNFKHGKRVALASLLARLMAARLGEFSDTLDRPLLVPVPLHRARLWQRGFNQSALIAKELERLGSGVLLVDGLMRHKRTPSLGNRSAAERTDLLADAISVQRSRQKRIAGRDAVLVDDVVTTGATSNACVKALKDAGARRVVIACFARVAR